MKRYYVAGKMKYHRKWKDNTQILWKHNGQTKRPMDRTQLLHNTSGLRAWQLRKQTDETGTIRNKKLCMRHN